MELPSDALGEFEELADEDDPMLGAPELAPACFESAEVARQVEANKVLRGKLKRKASVLESEPLGVHFRLSAPELDPQIVEVQFKQPFHQLHYECSAMVELHTCSNAEAEQRVQVERASRAMLLGWRPEATGCHSVGLCLPHEPVELWLAENDPPAEPEDVLERLVQHSVCKRLGSGETPAGPVVWGQHAAQLPVYVWLGPRARQWQAFLRRAVRRFPVARQLFTVLKLFLLQRGLLEQEPTTKGRYVERDVSLELDKEDKDRRRRRRGRDKQLHPLSLFVLIISFLQHHRSVKSRPLRCCTYLGHLLFDFFKVFGKQFSYEKTGVSVRGGGRLFDKRPDCNELCIESPVGSRQLDIGVPDARLVSDAFGEAHRTVCAIIGQGEMVRLFPWLLDGLHPMILRRHMPEDTTAASAAPPRKSGPAPGRADVADLIDDDI